MKFNTSYSSWKSLKPEMYAKENKKTLNSQPVFPKVDLVQIYSLISAGWRGLLSRPYLWPAGKDTRSKLTVENFFDSESLREPKLPTKKALYKAIWIWACLFTYEEKFLKVLFIATCTEDVSDFFSLYSKLRHKTIACGKSHSMGYPFIWSRSMYIFILQLLELHWPYNVYF